VLGPRALRKTGSQVRLLLLRADARKFGRREARAAPRCGQIDASRQLRLSLFVMRKLRYPSASPCFAFLLLFAFFLNHFLKSQMSPDRVPSALFKGLPRRRGKGGPFGGPSPVLKSFLNQRGGVASGRCQPSHNFRIMCSAPSLTAFATVLGPCALASLVRMRAILEDLDGAHRTTLRTHSALRRNVT